MKVLQKPKKIALHELLEMSKKMDPNLVKAVVDIEQEIILVDGKMHVDLEEILLEEYESQQSNLWGINLHPEKRNENNWIVFDSMINIRTWDNNPSRGVKNPEIQKKIIAIVEALVEKL